MNLRRNKWPAINASTPVQPLFQRTMPNEIEMKKYDPKARKHVMFNETKLQCQAGFVVQRKTRVSGFFVGLFKIKSNLAPLISLTLWWRAATLERIVTLNRLIALNAIQTNKPMLQRRALFRLRKPKDDSSRPRPQSNHLRGLAVRR